MRAGQRIIVTFPGRLHSPAQERAMVARTTPAMLPLPDGYIPVRFSDGARLLVHQSYITAEKGAR